MLRGCFLTYLVQGREALCIKIVDAGIALLGKISLNLCNITKLR